jgi:asparagine synthase (glutamine-hydrolysing)
MCGLAGYLGGKQGYGSDGHRSVLKRMTDAIASRGPDDEGSWFDMEQAIGLAHRRLAIVDLSANGHQPMPSGSGRYVIAFNGEIYNHMALRRALEAGDGAGASTPQWRGHSDTETLLAGFEVWGIRATVERAVGMFAFAVWDRETGVLTLGRDRVGEKPLYYGWQGQGGHAVFLFGSELKALRAHPAFERNINRGAVSLQLRHNYIPSPYSIYEGISKLPPGCLLTLSLRDREPRISAYWSGFQTARTNASHSFDGTPDEAVDALEALLKDAVSQQMMADVPLGAFLSGGIDSSTVVALMQAQSSQPIKTFSIGFHEEGYNEAEHAKAVASYLGTEHTELYVTAEEAMAVIPKLPTLYDEPFSDPSQIPTFLVSSLARRHVTVSLSGDAGDELFCGYQRYQQTTDLWRKIAAKPLLLRRLAAKGLVSLSPQSWNALTGSMQGLLPRFMRGANVGYKFHKGASVLESESIVALYLGLMSHWHDPASVVIDGGDLPTVLNGDPALLEGLSEFQSLMTLDMHSYLPDDILVKVDRAAMGVSLETRVPFLDHRVVEFALSLPQSMKIRDGQSKWILRNVLYRHVPRQLVDRPKMGFSVPIGHWLRGPLRDWAEALLDPVRLRNEGFLKPQLVRAKWEEHLAGSQNWEWQLWVVLMFQAWLEQQK